MQNILLYQRTAKRYEQESFTCSFVEELIRSTNKTPDNFYLCIREFPLRSLFLATRKRSDVVLVEVIKQIGDLNKVILVIECKRHEQQARAALLQLTGYMRDVDCIHGICMSPDIALIYRDSEILAQRGDLPDFVKELDLDENGIMDLIKYINEI